MQGGVAREVYEFIAVCVPVVVLGAPLGSVIGSHFHRQLLASLVYLTDTVALVSGYIIVKQTTILVVASVSIVISGFIFFGLITYLGHKIMNAIPEEEESQVDQDFVQRESAVSSTQHNELAFSEVVTEV